MSQLKVLVVDDSSMYRQILSDIVGTIPELTCIGSACNGRDAMAQILRTKPDFVTLDIEMPIMDGMEVMRALKAEKISTKILLVSAHSLAGAELTIQALELGAYDFITKPLNLRGGSARAEIRQQLEAKLLGTEPGSRVALTEKSVVARAARRVAVPQTEIKALLRPQAIVIGASTGGPKALMTLFEKLPGQLGLPIFIVQHMPPLFTKTLADSLNRISQLTVTEAIDGDIPVPDHVYMAPGGRQMKLVSAGGGVRLSITDDEVESSFRPSVNHFFASVASIYKDRAVGIILSGMGSDGTLGLAQMKSHGAIIFGQNEGTCVVYGMPRAAQEAGVVDAEIDINDMSAAIEKLIRPSGSIKMGRGL